MSRTVLVAPSSSHSVLVNGQESTDKIAQTSPPSQTADKHSPTGASSPDVLTREQDAASMDPSTLPADAGVINPASARHKQSKAEIFTIMCCLCACVFIAALEITIVATSLPAIAGHFASDSGYTWIGTAFILAHTASTPSWGKISDIWGRRPILLASNAIFLGGSLLCALVDELDVFIAGRAVQGVGAAGMMTMVNICIGDLFSQRDRGMYYGLTSVVWAVACAVGPVLGGVFTSTLSWRWCFWINLPVGGLAFLLLLFTLKLPSSNTPVWTGLKAIDWTGSLLIIGGTLMLLLGLYLGGVYNPWYSATVVCLLVFGLCAGILFVLNEWKLATYPIIPIHLFRSRSSAAAFAVCFFHAFAFMGVAYYLPLYFQAVLLASPIKSGLYMLPFILSNTIVAAMTGVYIQFTGKYMPAVYIGLTIMTLGIGLLVSLGAEADWGKLVSYQIVGGIGVGMLFEGPLLAVQAVVPPRDVAAATTTMGFVRTISTAISVVVGGVVFQNVMRSKHTFLQEKLGPGLARLFDGASASANVELVKALPADQRHVAKLAFYDSMRSMWIMYAVMSGVGLLLGFMIRAHHLSKEHHDVQIGLPDPDAQDRGQSNGIELQMTAQETADAGRRRR